LKESFELENSVHVIAEAVENGGSFTLFPMGTSMLPTIKAERDSVRLVKAQGIRKGDIILYKRKSGQFVLHRIVKLCPDGTLVLCGDNQRAFEKNVSREDVLFLVESYQKDGKTVERGSLSFCLQYRYARALQLVKAVYRRLFSSFCRKGT
jgi:uncharacterized phosphosugar-binding protein